MVSLVGLVTVFVLVRDAPDRGGTYSGDDEQQNQCLLHGAFPQL
jgi:hypothetical protein